MRYILLVALLVTSVVPLIAQTTDAGKSNASTSTQQPSATSNSSAGFSDEPQPAKFELFMGYSFLTMNGSVSGFKAGGPETLQLQGNKGGFLIDGSYFFNRWFGVTADSGAHFGDRYDADEALFGPTIRFPFGHFQPFVHGLVGWSRLAPGNSEQNDAVGIAAGGGIDVRASKHVSLRLFQADYVRSYQTFRAPNKSPFDGTRLAAGVVFLGGVGEELPVSASCSVAPTDVFVGEPVKATVTTQNFNPKHTLKYDWTASGPKIQGTGDNVTIDTTGLTEGQAYPISVHVSDPHSKKALATCQTSFNSKRRLPPTISCTATPNTVEVGATVTVHCTASSPQGGTVTVKHSSDKGNFTGEGTDLTVNTTSLQPGPVTITSVVTDDHQLNANATTTITVQAPPPPPPPPTPPPSLVLRSVYFATAQPTVKNPNGGLVRSQQATLTGIADEFKKYIAVKPDAKLVLQAHADPRGTEEYNQSLTERRADATKSFLVAHGIPAENLETQPLGKQHQLTPEEVKQSMEDDPSLTPGEKKRLTRNMHTIVLAANRRVDIQLNAPGVAQQQSVHEFPFSAADALSLIGGREKPKPAPTAKKPARKRAGKGTGKAAKKGTTKKSQ
jgi:outer membrane protein OmpA-like peptidoglycan-associated protein